MLVYAPHYGKDWIECIPNLAVLYNRVKYELDGEERGTTTGIEALARNRKSEPRATHGAVADEIGDGFTLQIKNC